MFECNLYLLNILKKYIPVFAYTDLEKKNFVTEF